MNTIDNIFDLRDTVNAVRAEYGDEIASIYWRCAKDNDVILNPLWEIKLIPEWYVDLRALPIPMSAITP